MIPIHWLLLLSFYKLQWVWKCGIKISVQEDPDWSIITFQYFTSFIHLYLQYFKCENLKTSSELIKHLLITQLHTPFFYYCIQKKLQNIYQWSLMKFKLCGRKMRLRTTQEKIISPLIVVWIPYKIPLSSFHEEDGSPISINRSSKKLSIVWQSNNT